MSLEAAMQYVRSADRTFVYGVHLTEVNLAVQKHSQLFVARLAGDHARHCVAVFTKDPQRVGHDAHRQSRDVLGACGWSQPQNTAIH